MVYFSTRPQSRHPRLLFQPYRFVCQSINQRTTRQTNNVKTTFAKKVTSNICKKCKNFILWCRLRGINLHT